MDNDVIYGELFTMYGEDPTECSKKTMVIEILDNDEIDKILY